MIKLLLIIPAIILFIVLPANAYEIDQETPVEELTISSLPEEVNDNFIILTNYSYSELAVEAVAKYILFFTDKARDKFSVWLSRSGRYIELMKEILREENIPEELVYIPLIESGFNSHARSPKRAVGYWQFIAATARKYELQIDWWKDERRDPVKSTVAAAHYLSDLYEMFGSWSLAMAAYNAGEGRINRALNRTNTDDYWSLLNTRYLKRETKNYVPKFIAASLIAKFPEEFGFEELEYHPPLYYDEVTLYSPIDLEAAAECIETKVEVIKQLNPELKRWCTPPNVPDYTLRIPEGATDIFFFNLSQMDREPFTVDKYTVKKGDSLWRIARRTGTPVKVIRDLNPGKRLKHLKGGMKIYLPPHKRFALERYERPIVKKVSSKQKRKILKTSPAKRKI